MATTTAMKMLHVRTLMEALIALVMMVIKVTAPHVEISMNVPRMVTIVMQMLLVSILPVASLVHAITDIPETVLFVATSMNVISIMITVILMQHA